jgi:peptidylprolyl isomerase
MRPNGAESPVGCRSIIQGIIASGNTREERKNTMAQARTGKHVVVNFTGKLDDGTVFATSENSAPIEFTMGDNEVLPAIEEAVEGMELGEMKTVQIPAEDIEVQIGQQFWVEQPGGEPVLVSVADVSEATVTIDANHPLAGEDLTFDLELIDVA